jgi:hypothetical protein
LISSTPIRTSREAECDDDRKAFERIFAKIVPPKKAGDIAPEGKKPNR